MSNAVLLPALATCNTLLSLNVKATTLQGSMTYCEAATSSYYMSGLSMHTHMWGYFVPYSLTEALCLQQPPEYFTCVLRSSSTGTLGPTQRTRDILPCDSASGTQTPP